MLAGVGRGGEYTRALKTYKRLCPTTHYCVDSSYVKNAFGRECVGKNHTDRGRKALELSVVVDQHGIPHGICCHPGNRPDVCLLQDTLRSMLVDVESRPLYADKGYDSRNNRKVCHAAGVQDRIFRRRTTATRRTHVYFRKASLSRPLYPLSAAEARGTTCTQWRRAHSAVCEKMPRSTAYTSEAGTRCRGRSA